MATSTPSGGRTLPYPFESLTDEWAVSVEMLNELERSNDGVVRADLASEVIQHLARYENAKSDAVYPVLRESLGNVGELEEAARYEQGLRMAMTEIRDRTRHVKPMNAHADDPEGLEHAIDGLVAAARAELGHDEEAIFPLAGAVPERARQRLAERLPAAMERASSQPSPSQNPIGRIVAEISERLERRLSDQSTPYHPGIDQVGDREQLGADTTAPGERAGKEGPLGQGR